MKNAKEYSKDNPFIYMSLGAGVQSMAMMVLAEQGKIQKPDVAIFADTQDEPYWVYEQLDAIEKWSSIPVKIVTEGKLSDALTGKNGKAYVGIPAFVKGDTGDHGMMRRQCTREYKIHPIEREVRKLLGYKKGQRMPEGVIGICQLGITIDEASRMKPSRTRWVRNVWPLIDLGLNRQECERIMTDAGFPMPKKSSCVYCPYRSDYSWDRLKKEDPDVFEEACVVDDNIRDKSSALEARPLFLHKTLTPLREVEFSDKRQSSFDWSCESGHCGV